MTTGYLLAANAVAITCVVLAWRRRAWLVAAGLALIALWFASQLAERTPTWLLVAVGLFAAGLVWHRFTRTSATVTRWGARIRRKSGVASTVDVVRVGSGVAMRRKAATVRPSLTPSGRWARWWQLVALPTCEVGLQLCRVGLLRVWISVEDVLVVFGGPRTGKTQYLAGRIVDAPGAVLVTSTRTDLYEITAALRSGRGPVYAFNATGLAGLPSTITFDPLTGCTDPVTAAERAADMLGAVATSTGRGGSGEREFWDAQARRVLAALLHAAALGGASMRDVHAWVSDPDAGYADITALLRRSPEKAFETDVAQFVTTNSRTRTSITSSVMPALAWLAHPAAAAAAIPGPAGFDVAELLESRATVYLAGWGGGPGRTAGLRTDRTHRPPSPHPGRSAAGRPARPRTHPWARRGGADRTRSIAALDRRHGRPGRDDRRRVPVPRPAAREVRRRGRCGDPEQRRRDPAVRRHPRPRRPPVLVHSGRRTRRARPQHGCARLPVHPHRPEGGGAGARAAGEPASRAGGRLPAWDAAGDRAGRAGPPPPRHPHHTLRSGAVVGSTAGTARPASRPVPPALPCRGARSFDERRPVGDPGRMDRHPRRDGRRRLGRDGPVVVMAARDDIPSIREIADLTRRLRTLSTAGRDADPTERAAFLADKAALIARIEAANHRAVTSDDVHPDAAEAAAESHSGERAAITDDGEEWSR